MNLTLALTLFSSTYSVSLECNITLTYVFIQSLNSTGLFSSAIKKEKKTCKANCMDLTFALLHENPSNKFVAFKYFMSYFGFERSDLVMQNYVVISGLQTNLKKPEPKPKPAQTTLFDNFKLHWPLCFPTQGFAFPDNLTILVHSVSVKEMTFQNMHEQQAAIAVYFYIQHCVCRATRTKQISAVGMLQLKVDTEW